MPTVHLLIKGRVHGVFYRATARRIAGELGIRGWIRNTSEGNVELMATGKEPALQQFIDWCRRGPEMAAVTEVIISKMTETEFDGFAIMRGGFF
jgi:acylphosphatase